jgi:hypothetical protein
MDKDYQRPRGMMWCGLIIGFLALVVTFWKETPAVLESVTELIKTLNPDPPRVSENKENQEVVRIVGTWQSGTSDKTYEISPRSLNTFFLNEKSGGQTIPVGVGTISRSGIVIEYTSPTKGRSAILRLQVSDDGNTMTGSFQGKEQTETGLLSFRKLVVG